MNRLWVQFSAAFVAVAVVAAGIMALLVNRAVETSFRGYVGQESGIQNAASLAVDLEAYYADHGSWEGAADLLPRQGGQGRSPGGQGGGVRFTLIDASGRVAASTDGTQIVGEAVQEDDLARAVALHQGETGIGWLLVDTPGRGALTQAQTHFLGEVRSNLLWAVGLAAAFALLVGGGISLLLSRPLRHLTEAARSVAGGALGSRVPISPTHAVEVRSLAESFNHMSQSLAEGEAARQRLTADIAHELRTPISVMRSQLQAMLDGVSTTDAEHVAVVFDQALHLARLVDDMRLLTQAEAGQLPLERKRIAPAALLERAQTLFEPLAQDAGLTLASACAPDLPDVSVDPDRLQQVLGNLVTNALRHTEPGGTITISAVPSDRGVTFAVTNSGVTLTPEQAKHVFDRFWRADEARSRDRGGAGLGLAIARQIVQLHGGAMRVEVGSDSTRFLFDLPAVAAVR